MLAGEELDLLQISRVRKSPRVTLQLQTNARLQGPPMIQPGGTSVLPPRSRPLSLGEHSARVNSQLRRGWLQDLLAVAQGCDRSPARLHSPEVAALPGSPRFLLLPRGELIPIS